MRARRRSRWFVSVLLCCGFSVALGQQPQAVPETTQRLVSQQNDSTQQADSAQPETQPTPQSVPVAPETTVIGRPGAFPAEQLPDTAALSATLTPTPTAEIGSALTIITGEEIRESVRTQASEVLRGVPGLDVVQQATPGSLTSVFIRGASPQNTKVLIDGIPVNDPSSASRAFDFSSLSTENIERIEVLRGPQSTLYGSDAGGGVVNIITKRGEGPATARVDLLGGSYGTTREGVNVSGGGNQGYYSLGASYLQWGGFSAADRRNGNTELDPTQQTNVSGRFGLTPSKDFDVDYTFRYMDVNAAIDQYDFVKGYPVDDWFRFNRNKTFVNRIQTRAMTLDGFWEHIVGFGLGEYNRTDTKPGDFDIPKFVGQTRKVDYQGNFYVADWNTFTVGTDYLAEASQTFPLPPSTNGPARAQQEDKGVWFQDQVRLWDKWFTTFGFRWDDYTLAGPANTYRATTLYRLPTQTGLHGSLGTSFRAPSLAELALTSDLRPERSTGWDAGIEQPFADGRYVVDCTYFGNFFTDLIEFDFADFKMKNIGHAYTSGVELSNTWNLNDRTALFGNYTYTFTQDLDIDQPLVRRPPHKARFGIRRQIAETRGTVILDCLYVGKRYDFGSNYPALEPLGEYWLVNLAGTYDLTERVQLLARIDNLLNEKYQEVFGYGTAGLGFYGGASVRW